MIVKEYVASGIAEPINPSQALIVQGIFLIDKQAVSQGTRIYYDDERDLKRYRLVLDCRATNVLKRIEFGDDFSFKVEKPFESYASKVGNVETKQSQVAAAAQLSTVEVKNRRYKTLLDITSAFHSISMEENLRSLFCFEWANRFYRFARLPMGWSLSPLYFDVAIKKILQAHEEKSKVLKAKYDVRNFQDDIVIFGEEKETADLVEGF